MKEIILKYLKRLETEPVKLYKTPCQKVENQVHSAALWKLQGCKTGSKR
jgi:hypothetical protein